MVRCRQVDARGVPDALARGLGEGQRQAPYLGQLPNAGTLPRIGLKALTPPHVRALYHAELDTGLAPSTVRYTHAVLNRALKQAVRWDLVPRNICEAVDLPKRKILARTS